MIALPEKSTRKARKKAKKARKTAVKKHKEFEKAALATARTVKRRGGVEKEPRRWPWVFLALAVGTAVFVLLRRKKDDAWTPAPAGDGPVPSYREDPVPSSPSDSGKTVSTAESAPGDSTPPSPTWDCSAPRRSRVTAPRSRPAGRRRAGALQLRGRHGGRPDRRTVRQAGLIERLVSSRSTPPLPRATGASASAVPCRAWVRRPLRHILRVPPSSRPAASCSASRCATARCRSSASPSGSRLGSDRAGVHRAEVAGPPRGPAHRLRSRRLPNIYECWEDREATFLIGGDQCTRRCDFCQIDTGKPADFDADEPRRVAESVATMGPQVRHRHRRRP